MNNKFIIDGNSLGHFANNGSRMKLGDFPIQAVYGTLRTLRRGLAVHSQYDPIVLWDGMSWRNQIFPGYKAIRDKEDTQAEKKQAEKKREYKQQVPLIKKALSLLGIPQVSAINMEADDLGAMMSDKYAQKGKVSLWTGDQDWIQLVKPNVIWRDFIKGRTVKHTTFFEETGCKTPKQFVEMKALCGDAGDSIPGVGGIGEKGAKQFLAEYGSFNNFMNGVMISKTIDYAKLPKKYQSLIKDEEKAIAFEDNIRLVDLRTDKRPKPINLKADTGEPSKELFRTFCDRLLFQSITQEYDEWIRVFPAFGENK